MAEGDLEPQAAVQDHLEAAYGADAGNWTGAPPPSSNTTLLRSKNKRKQLHDFFLRTQYSVVIKAYSIKWFSLSDL